MATAFTIQVQAPRGKDPRPAMQAAFEKIAALDKMMSDYDPESELSKLGASSPHEQPVEVSEDLWRILALSQRISVQSGGAFDVTVGPLTKVWRQARRQKKLPDEEKLKEALAAVGYGQMKLSGNDAQPRTVQLTKPNMRLDLGGIAQGYAADAALTILVKAGFERSLINASGDIVAGDPPPEKDGWKVGLVALDPQQSPTKFVSLEREAVSTSGDAFQFTVIDGKRYSHIVDPRTGQPLTTPMSVTVSRTSCAEADAFATALCVLGTEASAELIEREALRALFVISTEEGVKTTITPDFKPYLIEAK